MAANRTQQLLDIEKALEEAGDDLVELSYIIGRYKEEILTPGITRPKDVASAKETIRQYIENERKLFEDKRESLKKRSRDLIKNLKTLRKRQTKCGEYFERASRELSKMGMFTTCQLYRVCQDYKHQFQNRAENLKRGRLKLLLTGEICAGKSSVLCKLMGGAYLPVDHGPCTRIPCEVVHSDDRKAYIFYKNNPCAHTEIELSKDESDASWNRLRECIETARDPGIDAQKTVEKVQIFWPIIFFMGYSLQDEISQEKSTTEELPEISFVDVPGIVDRDETLETLIPYMKDADAHIIVLNNADHQGIDKNRVVALMEQLQRIWQQGHGTFQPKLALFLCNKWDRVDKRNQAKLYRDIGKSLRGIWPKVSNGQIIPCEASDSAIAAVKEGSVEDMHTDFLIKMCDFLETAIRLEIEVNSCSVQSCQVICHMTGLDNIGNRISISSRSKVMSNVNVVMAGGQNPLYRLGKSVKLKEINVWLASILDRCISLNYRAYHESSFFNENKKLMCNQLQTFRENLLKFDQNRKGVDQEINKKTDAMRKETKKAIQQSLINHKERLSDWKETTFPKYSSNESWTDVQTKLATAIVERLENHIINDIDIQNIKDDFDVFVKEKLSSLINEYQQLINEIPLIVDLADGMDEKLQALNINNVHSQEKVIMPYMLSVLAVLLFPLAPIILLFWQIYDELNSTEFNKTEEDFFENTERFLANQTIHFIESILRNKLVSVSEAAIQDATRNAKFTIYFLHNSTEVYLKSVKNLLDYLESNQEKIDSVTDIEHISQELKQYVVEDIVQDDFQHQLHYNFDDSSTLLDGGNCTAIYKGEFTTADNLKETIVVKRIKQPLGDGNFPEDTFIMRELYLFQMLSHKPPLERKNFIEFYGFQTVITAHEFHLLLVTEWCDYSLEKMIKTTALPLQSTSESIQFPGKYQGNGIARAYVLDLSLQVAKGVRFLHRYNIVHRDIKPGNFMVKVHQESVCVKLIDLGISKKASEIKTQGPRLGTLCYNAPEIQNGGVHSTASDVYSACLIFWELWYGQLMTERARQNIRIPPNIDKIQPPSELKTVMICGWKEDISRRPNMMQIVAKLQSLCHTYRMPAKKA